MFWVKHTHSALYRSGLQVSNYHRWRFGVEEQQKHVWVRHTEQLKAATATCSHLNKSSSWPTAIWFPSCQRPTTRKDAAESAGIHCRSSLYRDLSGAGKPALALPGPADGSSRDRGSWAGLRPVLDAFCLLHKGNWTRFSTVHRGWRQLVKVFIYISTDRFLD